MIDITAPLHECSENHFRYKSYKYLTLESCVHVRCTWSSSHMAYGSWGNIFRSICKMNFLEIKVHRDLIRSHTKILFSLWHFSNISDIHHWRRHADIFIWMDRRLLKSWFFTSSILKSLQIFGFKKDITLRFRIIDETMNFSLHSGFALVLFNTFTIKSRRQNKIFSICMHSLVFATYCFQICFVLFRRINTYDNMVWCIHD